MKELEYYLEQVKLHGRLIGAISAIYDIPLAEIHELEKRIKEDKKKLNK